MTFALTAAANEGRLTGLMNRMGDGAYMLVFGGMRPVTTGAATAELYLARAEFATPAGVVAGNYLTLTLDGTLVPFIVARTGVATWARFYAADDVAMADADVSILGGTGDVQMFTEGLEGGVDPCQVYAGGQFTLGLARIR